MEHARLGIRDGRSYSEAVALTVGEVKRERSQALGRLARHARSHIMHLLPIGSAVQPCSLTNNEHLASCRRFRRRSDRSGLCRGWVRTRRNPDIRGLFATLDG